MRGHPRGGSSRAVGGGWGGAGGGAGAAGDGGRNLMMLPIPHNPKKIEMLLPLCAIHRQPITITMTCSICQQKGHNKQTCSVVVRYQYDDCGVRCRINPNDDQDFQPVETYCLPCGAKTEECDCGEYKCGKWFNEETGKFQGAPRARRQTRFNPIDHPALFTIAPAPETKEEVATTGKYAGMTAVQIEAIFAERERKNYEELVAPIIAPKLACADCGQVETECHLEITEQGKILCCDCLYPENQEDDDETETDDEGMEDCEDCGYTHHREDKCPNEATSCHYEKWREEEEEEDTCECCGKPYDHRNPHRQSEMCDCVQNDDGTLSRPEEVPELPCPDCRRWFDEGKERCKSCDYKFDGEEEDSDDESVCECCKCEMLSDGKGNPDSKSQFYEELGEWYCGRCYEYHTRPSPTRDQLIALGKYKLAKFQIGKQDQRDETNWNEDGDDELCSAIDASGNALY